MEAREPKQIPLSILDLATILEGETIADSFHTSFEMARHAEQLGYLRYWFAEHHNMESIASSATSVLIGYVAGGTSKIRVGSGGVMLPNHAPLIIAEQFGTLETLYPGRIDLGLGRAPGTDPLTSAALRRYMRGDVDDFPADVVELRNYFAGRSGAVKAVPGMNLSVPIWLLGSSTYSAQLAAALGLPFAFASHFAPTHLMDALKLYRENYQPSDENPRSYAMACVSVIVADTDEEAQRLATSARMMILGIFRNQRRPLQPPVDTMQGKWSAQEEAAVNQWMHYSFVGSPATVKKGLDDFLQNTGIDELMITTQIYDKAAKKRSLELLAGLYQS